jgi:hypothetical protein
MKHYTSMQMLKIERIVAHKLVCSVIKILPTTVNMTIHPRFIVSRFLTL